MSDITPEENEQTLTVAYASMTLSDGRIFQITDIVQSIVDAVEGHYDRLRESVDEEDGNYEDGHMEWESTYARAEGEESIANEGMSLAKLVGIEHPSPDDWPEVKDEDDDEQEEEDDDETEVAK